MTFGACAALAVAATIVELFVPGRAVYHTGWFNVALLALAVVAIAGARKAFVRTNSTRVRLATAAVALGAVLAALAGSVSGLLAPDNRTVVGAPGQTVRVDELGGALRFPPVAAAGGASPSSQDTSVTFERSNRPAIPVAERARNVGTFIVRATPRQVVFVQARDLSGGTLTVTQPSGSSFLSPVMLMQQSQTIAGLDVPFDSFAVPSAHRVVKAVLFSAQEAATMRGLQGAAPSPAVLFAVDDEDDRPLPHAIAIARSGSSVSVGRLRLYALVLSYPAIEIVASPALGAVVAAALLVAGGLIVRARTETLSPP